MGRRDLLIYPSSSFIVFFLITFLLPLRLPPDVITGGSGVGSLAGAGLSITGGGVGSLEGALDISSSESSSIILRKVSLRSDLVGPMGLGFTFVLVVDGMKSSSCSDSDASFIGSVGLISSWYQLVVREWIGKTDRLLSHLLQLVRRLYPVVLSSVLRSEPWSCRKI